MSTIDTSASDMRTSRFSDDYRSAPRAAAQSSFDTVAKIKESAAAALVVDRVRPEGRSTSPDPMPFTLKVRDVMSNDVISVPANASVQEIAEKMHRNRIGSIPVVDRAGRICGVVSEADLIQRAEIGTQPRRSWWQVIFRDAIADSYAYVRSHGRKARDVMTRDPFTTTADEPLRKAADTMARKRLRHMPVIDNERVIGMVSRSDIIRALAKRSATETKASADSDLVVRERVFERIRSLPWGTSMHVANLIVSNGVVWLYGWSASNIERRAIHVVVENTPGVRRVEDRLHRTLPYV